MATVALTENRTVAEVAPELRPGPLFVVGMWRSGTSLLYALLNQHPEIALMYEAELALLRPLFWMPGGSADWAERWNFWNSALDRHQIRVSDVPSGRLQLPDALRAVYTEYARRKGASIWGGKSPNYYDSLTRLARTFPQAQFIVIWRDPADICRSVMRAGEKDDWFSKRGIPHRTLFGLHQMKRECDQLVARGVPVHQIRFEDLIHDTASTMTRICQFLNIPFDSRMTSLAGADRSAVYEGEHHAGVKSEKIVERKPRPEVLPAQLLKKIRRYMSFWRAQYGAAWLPPAQSEAATAEAGNPRVPGRTEQIKDELLFRAIRTLDAAVVIIYCFAPLALLRKYREAKAQKRGLSVVGESAKAKPVALNEPDE
jgi:hypothetical protein